MVLDGAADYALKDKIVVITGGGSGISLSYAQIAHSLGAKIIIGDLKLTTEAEAFFKEAGDERIVFQPCDVTKWDQLQQLVATSEKKYGDVPDVWIAGAGVFEPSFSNFWDDPEDTCYAEVSINVSHPIKLTRIAFRALLGKNKPGTVLIISSIAGIQGSYPAPLYCATKHAVVGFVKSLVQAEELEGIRVMAILPGLVHTPLWTSRPDHMTNFSYSATDALSPTDVAERMIELCQQAKYGGGTILETAIGGTRVVPEWNVDPPKLWADPAKNEKIITATGEVTAEKMGGDYSHISQLLQKERGVAVKG